MDKSTYLRVGQVDLSIGRVVFKNTGIFRERRTFFLDLGLDGAVIVRSKGEQCSRMEEGAEERRVIGGGPTPVPQAAPKMHSRMEARRDVHNSPSEADSPIYMISTLCLPIRVPPRGTHS